jgi:hypothetical protein
MIGFGLAAIRRAYAVPHVTASEVAVAGAAAGAR